MLSRPGPEEESCRQWRVPVHEAEETAGCRCEAREGVAFGVLACIALVMLRADTSSNSRHKASGSDVVVLLVARRNIVVISWVWGDCSA